jgi:hypothetical protein
MAGFGGFNEKKKKKQKKDGTIAAGSFGSTRPEYTMPTVIPKERKEK